MASKFDVFDIKLERSGPYLSGDIVRGELLLKSKKERNLARVVIHLFGGGRVEIPSAKDESSTAVHRDSQTYLRQSQVLLDRGSLAKSRLLKLAFELRLPERLPSSFGSVIVYSLTALVDRGTPGKASALTQPIVVIANFDLNNRLSGVDLWQPIEAWAHWQQQISAKSAAPSHQQRQQQECLGLATVRLIADKRGFAIGEQISLSVELRNNTKVRLDSIRVCLTQKAVLKASADAIEEYGAVARREQRQAVEISRLQERLKPGASLLEDSVYLTVPTVATASPPGCCRLLRISYWLQVVCSATAELLSVASFEPAVQTLLTGSEPEQVTVLLEEPVVIGTSRLVPAAESSASAAASANVPARRLLPPAPPPRPSAPPAAAVQPSAPPSYEESLLQRLRDEDSTGVFS